MTLAADGGVMPHWARNSVKLISHQGSLCRSITINHMLRLRALLLLLIACFLPLQTATAWAMPLSHDAAQQAGGQDEASGAHCHLHEAEATVETNSDPTCDACGVCHLASAGFLLAAGDKLAEQTGIDVLVPLPLASLRSHIPEPPSHPPRHSA
jgi:hypothetical protein